MRILVYPHDLAMGGSQLNAIELAAAVRDLGHTVAIYGRAGSLNDRIRQLGLEFIAAPVPGRRPSPRVIGDLRAVIRDRGIDIVHGYEWPPVLEAALAVRGSGAIAVATVMSMSVAPFIPRTMTVQVGTEQIASAERARGRLRVDVMEPPVDLVHNAPGSPGALRDFRVRWGVADGEFTVVCVSRLAHQLKLEGLLSAIRATGELAARLPVRLLLVGDGPARQQVSAAAADANRRAGREVVTLTGELLDPRPAYASADVVIGMGGSALRALAFGKPLIVQGEHGYFRLLSPQTVDEFLWQGWYGIANPAVAGHQRLADLLADLLPDPARRDALGAFGRRLVETRFSLHDAARRQVEVYVRSAGGRAGRSERALGAVASLVEYGRYQARRKALRLVGRRATDDFNAEPVAGWATDRSRANHLGMVVYVAGVPWDGVRGTDRQLVTAVSTQRPVLWVDPPVSVVSLRRARRAGAVLHPVGLSAVSPTIWRLRVRSVPGFSRPVARSVARAQLARAVRRAASEITLPVHGVVLAHPMGRFPGGLPGRRLYYVTDDWPEAAGMMGLGRRAILAHQRHNLRSADVVAAVSDALVGSLGAAGRPGLPMHVLPNGCTPSAASADTAAAGPGERRVGLVGQLNERLDFDILDALAATGSAMLVVGPRTDRDPRVRERLDRFLSSPTVHWVGPRPAAEIPDHLSRVAVGITPYVDSAFNRASFPLKTLEYLAAGLPVVSTDLPATRWLDTDLIDIAGSPAAFVDAVAEHLTADRGEAAAARRAFAETHSWRARADTLLELLDGRTAP